MLEWFAKLDTKLACEFLERWPSLEELQAAAPAEVRKFFRQHRGRHPELTEWRLQGIGQAMSAIRDRAVIEAKRMVVQVIARVLRTLLEGIAALDGKITEAAEAHPDFFSFSSRFREPEQRWRHACLAALGSQRDRYASAEEVQKYSGIAPVTERSGKKKWVHFRWACPKFLRQSFHEWAGHSIAQSVWRVPITSNSAGVVRITMPWCEPWLSNGFASCFAAGKTVWRTTRTDIWQPWPAWLALDSCPGSLYKYHFLLELASFRWYISI